MIVMKFGGTSVQDAAAIRRVASIVAGRQNEQPLVVVSAMGGVTDKLVQVAESAARGELSTAVGLLEGIKLRHVNAAGEMLSASAKAHFAEELDERIAEATALAARIAAAGSITPAQHSCMLTFGELLSSVLVAAAFNGLGVPGVHADSRQLIVTDSKHPAAAPLPGPTQSRLLEAIPPLLEQGLVPVMGGFIAASESGEVTTLGRGGSDYSAAIVGGALNAARIEIWTDVSGILTTDPRICPQAQRIAEISFHEAAELACFGAKVLHPATLLPAIDRNIPVAVLNSHKPQEGGTIIRATAAPGPSAFRAIAVKRNISVFNVSAPRQMGTQRFLDDLFSLLRWHHLKSEIVAISGSSASVAVEGGRELVRITGELQALGNVDFQPEMAIICLVGEDIRGCIGIASEVFGVLATAGINIRMIAQGSSEISVSFVIEEKDAVRAVQQLHHHLFEQTASTPSHTAGAARKTVQV
ncbi:MAG: aspartate kinase [Acidobacteriota bacterium]|nr:aspartate kinase [Acidobacteriota bacterium]